MEESQFFKHKAIWKYKKQYLTQPLGGHESFCGHERFFSFKASLKGKRKSIQKKSGGKAFLAGKVSFRKESKSLYAFGYL